MNVLEIILPIVISIYLLFRCNNNNSNNQNFFPFLSSSFSSSSFVETKNNNMIRKKILIIGTGISGATTASLLKAAGKQCYFDITIFDKGRGAGGRMTTSRSNKDERMHLDLGAQYIYGFVNWSNTNLAALSSSQLMCFLASLSVQSC